MKTYLFSFILMLLPIAANADAVIINGFYYNLDTSSKTAEVTSNPNKYSGAISIPETVTYGGVEYSVTAIGKSAFRENSGLTSVIIPNSMLTIGEGAFQFCWSLASVTLGNKVKEIGQGAFRETGLTSITIPASVTTIGWGAFAKCSLAGINITDLEAWCKIDFKPSLYNTIIDENDPLNETGDGPLLDAKHLLLNGEEIKDLVIPSSITTIKNNAFEGGSFTSVSIHEGVTSIGVRAFRYCRELTSANIPSSIRRIGCESFYGCGKLASPITIPEGVTSIEGSAFYECSKLPSVTFPNSLKTIGSGAFDYCSSLTSLVIPSNVKEFYVAYCDRLASVVLPAGTTKMGFYYCRDLKDVYCHAVNVPEYNYSTLFDRCYPEFITLHVPAGSENNYSWIANFKDVVALSDEDQPSQGLTPYNHDPVLIDGIWYQLIGKANAAEVIRDPSFSNPIKYSGNIVIPEEVTCDGVKYKVTHIYQAFLGCSGLTSLTIPSGMMVIEDYFEDCNSLTAVNISDLTGWCNIKFASNPLYSAHHLYLNGREIKDLVIPDGITSIKRYAFDGCTSLTSVTIPDGVTTINEAAFRNCTGLTHAIIRYDVYNIGKDAFLNCSNLASVVIGEAQGWVMYLGPNAFGNCTALKDFYSFSKEVPNSVPGQGLEFFTDTNIGNATLHVPETCMDNYKAADVWKDFGKFEVLVDIDPITTSAETTFGGEFSPINEQTDLTDAVIENTYYTMDADNGDGYDAQEQAIVLNSTTTDEQMNTVTDGKVGEESVRDNYAGIILEVSGSGTVSVDAKTIGTHVLNMQIGKDDPVKIAQSERGEVEITYNVDKPTYVYIYASSNNAASRAVITRGATENSVLLYGYKIVVDPVRKGDANGDGKVDEKDIEVVTDFIMDRPLLNGISLEGAKANGDNAINAADIVTIINIIKKKNK